MSVGVRVTIEGSSSPCTELPRGHVKTVPLTPHVQRLIDGGYVVVRERFEPTPPLVIDEPMTDEGPLPPARNASRKEWADFLTGQGWKIAEGDGRDDLRDSYEAFIQAQETP